MIPERLQVVAAETEPISTLFSDAGFKLYLVGGIVRDAVMNRITDLSDLDFTTDALPDQIEAIVADFADAMWLQGKRFGTIALKKDDRIYEITTHRAEAYSPDSRKPDVQFSNDIEADLSRRDFTINAMALSLPELTLIDPFDGIGDLVKQELRTPLDPHESFGDDPLRMLRAARFMSQLRLTPTDELLTAATELADRLPIVSAERIRAELDKLLVTEVPSYGLNMLVRTGLADQFLPELPALALQQDPVHRHKDVLAHTIAVVDKASPDRILRLACLLHDIGKPKTRAITANGVTFHHHDVVGARMARDRMRALKYSSDDIQAVSKLVELHLRFHTYKMGWTESAIRRYVRDAGPLLGRLNELTRCDCTTRNQARAAELSRRMDELEEKIQELSEREALDALRPEIDGAQVMAHLGIEPGPMVGKALNFLLQIRLDEGLIGEEAALARLDTWYQNQR